MIKINILFIGYGEIGSSIGNIVKKKHKIFVCDNKICTDIKQPKDGFDVMHICMPHSKTFIKDSISYINMYHPNLIIIESTVFPETTKKIYDATHTNIVHSPVIGIHPHISKSLKTFTKFIGPTTKKAGTLATTYYNSLGIKTKLFSNSLETETAKLLSTTTYGIYIAWATKIYNICKENNLNFHNVYSTWTENYNSGYKKLKMKHVKRPILKPCIDGLGGHCIHENAILLYKYFKSQNKNSDFINEILKLGTQK